MQTGKQYVNTMLNNTTTSAMTFAVKLLGLRNHSREELKRKLLRKGYAPEKIEPVLDKLTAQGVLDDMIFSIELIKSRSRRKPSGKLKIHAELRQRGVAETIIEELLNEYESIELCYRAAEKKIGSLHGTTDINRKKKLEVFLRNRGFGWAEIQIVLKRFFQPGSDDLDNF